MYICIYIIISISIIIYSKSNNKEKLLNEKRRAILYMLFYIKSFTDQYIIFNIYYIFISIYVLAVYGFLIYIRLIFLSLCSAPKSPVVLFYYIGVNEHSE